MFDPDTKGRLATDDIVQALKAVAEPTRLRLLMLLRDGDLNVKDLTQILDQSQPRLSRHLKLLTEAGLVERFREGSWVYFHISQRTLGGSLTLQLLEALDVSDPVLARDRRRLEALKKERETAAQEYFRDHAADWDRVRSLHVSEDEVEAAMLDMLGDGPFQNFVDLGTGTGRILELFLSRFEEGLGVDVNNTMLSYARSKLGERAGSAVQMRHGDIYNLPVPDGAADAVVMHQVLHYLSDPAGAIAESSRILKPDGQLLIADFAPHELEFLREQQAHDRLGFSKSSVETWMRDAGLTPTAFRELKPAPSGTKDKLTVSIWLGRRTIAAERPEASADTQPILEETP